MHEPLVQVAPSRMMMTLISLIAKGAVCGHVVDKMAAETGQKRPLRDQAAHEHENVLSDDLYSVKCIREERKLKGSNEVVTFFNFSKASIGSGSFALPWAVKQSGILVGSAGLVLLGVVSAYTMQLILQCKHHVTKGLAPDDKQKFTFTDIGRAAGGVIGKWSVDFSVILCNIGVCAGYTVFIASNIQWAISCLPAHVQGPEHQLHLSIYDVYAVLIPILILLTFLPSFKYLAYAAYIGMVFLVVAMVTVYAYGIGQPFQGVEVGISYYEWKTLPQFFGAAAFLFCVHTMVVPLESNMKRPWNMQYVVDAAAIIVVGVNLPFAIYAYLLFGEAVQGYCFENLFGIYPDIVRLTLAVELTLTYPIVIKPPSDVVEEIGVLIYDWAHQDLGYEQIGDEAPKCTVRCHGLKSAIQFMLKPYSRLQGVGRKVVRGVMVCIMRAVLVLMAFAIAAPIPHFELVVALVGGLATTIAAFILPPAFHLLLFWKLKAKPIAVLNIIILLFGVVASTVTTATTIMQIVAAGQEKPIFCYADHTNATVLAHATNSSGYHLYL